MNNYVVYHLHSDLSTCVTSIDSITKYNQYIDKAKECGMKAMAFSEHGSVFMWVKKKEAIEAAGMKYIHAEEFYVTETLDEKIRDNKHCCLIAKNYDGVLELNRLSSISFNKEDGHKYYNPRITIDELINTSDNIIITTACLGGILVHGSNDMRLKFLRFIIKNKHRCFLEIQHHLVEEQIRYNQYLYELNKKYGIPLICGTDTHALNEEHMRGRAMLQKAKNVTFPDENLWDMTFKSYEELVDAYKKQNSLPMDVVLEAIDNTNKMADMVEEFSLDKSYKYPHLWEEPEELIKKKIADAIKWRGVDKYPNFNEYKERIEHELASYKHNKAIDFMLLMEDIVSWCKTQDIQIGYGRGSCNGSVIAWLLGITEMDSIKHKLNFERFMSLERVSLSDIDSDFPPSRINDVKNYIFQRNGLYCCDIVTFNTIADKGAIRDIGRALSIPLDTVNSICNSIDNEENYKKLRNEYEELFYYVDLVKGVIVSMGSHPCGCVVSPYSLDDRMGLCTTSTDDYQISQIYMKEIDGLNYVKLDLLKLDTIELINNTCKLANIERLTPDNIDVSDVNVWNSMRDDTTAIFQWEGNTGNEYIKKLLSDENIEKFKVIDENVDRMTLLSIGNSAIRPAGASYRNDLANGVVRKSGSKAIDDFLKPTFGYLVFQCQIIDFLHQYCGFTMGEADIVRRHFAKKTGTENDIPIIKNGGYISNGSSHYIKGFNATMKELYNMEEDEAERTIVAFLQVIEDASRYLFSLNHSQPYSYEGYACAWLRYYYPSEFLTCSLNLNFDNEEKTKALVAYALRNNVSISPIKFRHSIGEYSCDAKNHIIYKGLNSIKFISKDASNDLYELKDNEYDSFIDLLIDIDKTSVNSKQLTILIKLDFFSEFGEINQLLKQYELYNRIYGKKQFKKDRLEELEIPEYIIKKHAAKETEKQYRDFDSLALLKDICGNYKYQKTSIIDKINYEQENLGYVSLTMPNIKGSYYYITDISGYSNNVIHLYKLKNGEIIKIKVRAKTLKSNPLMVGKIINALEMKEDFKWKKTADGFERTNERELILTEYSVLQ